MTLNDIHSKRQDIVTFISKQNPISNRNEEEQPLNFGNKSPISIKISGFNCFSKNKTKNDYKEKSLRKLKSKEILKLIDCLYKSIKNENNDNNSNFLQNEFVIRIPYNEDKENNYVVPFSLEIDIEKEKIDPEKYEVFLIKSDGYSSADFNKGSIKKFKTIEEKNEFIMEYFHVSCLGMLSEILEEKGYTIELPTNSTNINKGYWRFQILIVSLKNGIEYHKSYPFTTITSNQMFRDKSKRNSFLTKLISKSENEKTNSTEKIKRKEMIKYYRDIFKRAKKEDFKFDLNVTLTFQKEGEIEYYIVKCQEEVEKILTQNISDKEIEYWIYHPRNIYNGDIYDEGLFNEKNYEEKINKKWQQIKIKLMKQEKQRKNKSKQHQEEDEGPIKAVENQHHDNAELTQENKSEQHQEENEGPIEVYENQYIDNSELIQESRSQQYHEENEGPINDVENQYIDNSELIQESRSQQYQEENKGPINDVENQYHDNAELTQENKSEQHQEENERPIEVYENQCLDNSELIQESRSQQYQEENEGPINDVENQYHDNAELTQEGRNEQEIDLGSNKRKRRALNEIEHGNNKKNKYE